MIYEAVADNRRYYADKAVNEAPVKIVDSKMAETDGLAEDLMVGQVILLTDGMKVPADCVILKVENRCYVNTSQLDGELNLKPRYPTSNESVEGMKFDV